MTIQPGANLYTLGGGTKPENVEVPVITNHNPSTTDVTYPIGKRWINDVTNQEFTLTSITSSNGILIANWIETTNAPAMITIDGDTGSATGNVITFTAHPSAGSSPSFDASGTTVTFNVTDVNTNTIIGRGSGNPGITGTNNVAVGDANFPSMNAGFGNTSMGSGASFSMAGGTQNCAFGLDALFAQQNGNFNVALGPQAMINSTNTDFNTAVGFGALGANQGSSNTAVGFEAAARALAADILAFGSHALFACTTGQQHVAIGATSLGNLTTGNADIAIGSAAGNAYTSTESSNIVIQNPGVLGDNNTIRIGTQGAGLGQQNTCFIAGITGVAVSNLNFVTINTATGQLGSQSTVHALIWQDTSGAFTAVEGNGYILTAASTITMPAVGAEGDTIAFFVDTGGTVVVTANGGQILRVGAAVSAIAGTATNTSQGDSLTFVFRSATSAWLATSVIGTWNVV